VPLGEKGMALFEQAMQVADSDELRRRVKKISLTALRLALEPVWWNAIEARRRSRILKTTLEEELVAIQPGDLRRYRGMARKLFALAEKHGLEMYYEGGQARESP